MQKNSCDTLCHSVEKKCWILTLKPTHKVEVTLKLEGIFLDIWEKVKKYNKACLLTCI